MFVRHLSYNRHLSELNESFIIITGSWTVYGQLGVGDDERNDITSNCLQNPSPPSASTS